MKIEIDYLIAEVILQHLRVFFYVIEILRWRLLLSWKRH